MHEYIAVSPFDKIQIPSVSKNKHSSDNENVLNSEQLSRFLDHWSKQELNRYAYFRLLAYSGMRRGKIIALTWGDIDFQTRMLNIDKSIGLDYRADTTNQYLKSTKSTSSNRRISLDKKTLGRGVHIRATVIHVKSLWVNFVSPTLSKHVIDGRTLTSLNHDFNQLLSPFQFPIFTLIIIE